MLSSDSYNVPQNLSALPTVVLQKNSERCWFSSESDEDVGALGMVHHLTDSSWGTNFAPASSCKHHDVL